MKTLVIIPARLTATRLPGKPLLKINGLSIISHVFKRAEKANIGADVVAAEDNEIIDDVKNVTLVSASSIDKEIKEQKKNKSELSTIVAEKLAKKANEKNIKKIYFDRGIYKYHGRVKIFAETLRKNGMEF